MTHQIMISIIRNSVSSSIFAGRLLYRITTATRSSECNIAVPMTGNSDVKFYPLPQSALIDVCAA